MYIAKRSKVTFWEDALIRIVIFIMSMVCLYPFIYVVSMSISDPVYVLRNDITFLPKGFSLDAYRQVLRYKNIAPAYGNTIWYTVVGTGIQVFLTSLTAYPLARRDIVAKKWLMLYFVIPMFIGGGLIPTFILITTLGLYNTRWAVIMPYAMTTWNLIITKQYMQGISSEILDAASVDGCGELRSYLNIVVPLSKPIIAVVALYAAVGFWNSYMPALLYLVDSKLHPLQILLVSIVVQNSQEMMQSIEGYQSMMAYIQMKYCVIILAVFPIICIYPFLQKYFVKGIMIGSLKG